MPTLSLSLTLPLSMPASVRPAPGPARGWLRDELARSAYQRGLLDRVFSWLLEHWQRLQHQALDASPLSTAAVVFLAVVALVLLVVVLGRTRREPGRSSMPTEHLTGTGASPAEHRAAATAALAAGQADRAVVEAFRAIATRSVRRGLVEDRPGLTAHELTLELAPLFPAHRAELDRASATFDVACYGDRPATAADAQQVLDLDDALRAARPDRGAASAGSALSVPR